MRPNDRQHKPTDTGVYLNWTSLTPRKYKINLIKCLLDRVWKICLDEAARELEVKRLRCTLLRNDYPEHILDKEIGSFVKYLKRDKSKDAEKKKDDGDAEKTKKFIKLRYRSTKMVDYARKLTGFVNSSFVNIDLQVVLVSPRRVGDLFKFKDRVTDPMKQSNVVYHLKCKDCDAEYIGKTERILLLRMKEHWSESASNQNSTHRHCIATGHTIDYDNVKILDRADKYYKILLKEQLHIDKRKPKLNIQHNSQEQYGINCLLFGSKKIAPQK